MLTDVQVDERMNQHGCLLRSLSLSSLDRCVLKKNIYHSFFFLSTLDVLYRVFVDCTVERRRSYQIDFDPCMLKRDLLEGDFFQLIDGFLWKFTVIREKF